jgi:myo-inositol-1(or 4)-monophosphatase
MTLKKINAEEFLAVAEAAAREAGAYQKSAQRTGINYELKGEINLVTEVDKNSEKMIIARIAQKFPDHDIMAEEGSAVRKDSPYKWIIDPLDGTTNFAHGYPLFCVSIALEFKGEVIAGVVYDPMRDELFSASQGGGAFLNGIPITVSAVNTLNAGMLATGFAYNFRETDNNNLNHFRAMMMTAQAVRRDGVAAIDLCYVACGRYDGFWELNLFPWDVAAGCLILTEAGGKVTRFDGSAFSIYDKDICTSNSSLHAQMVKVLTHG